MASGGENCASGQKIDQSSFASILAGVQLMRDAYEPVVSEKAPEVRQDQPPQETTRNNQQNPPERRPEPPKSSVPPPLSLPRPASSNVPERPDRRRELSTHNGQVAPGRNPRPIDRSSGHRSRQGVQTYTSVQVANSQKGNPLLESALMKLTPWSYSGDILSDYYINATLQVLFLSLKYHKLRPEYVWRRIERLKGTSSGSPDPGAHDKALRVLLVVVDIDLPQEAIRHLLGICMKLDLSMVVVWSFEEAGNYIAYFKQNELAHSKIDSSIQGLKKGDYNLNIVSTLTSVRAVNKTDVANLLANCKSFKNVVLQASLEDGLKDIQGLGLRKLQNLRAVFTEPFVLNKDYDA